MKQGDRFRFANSLSPNDGVLVEYISEPGYSVIHDAYRDDFANVRIVEGEKSGFVSACDKNHLTPV
jgi:hypothetical protein